MNRYRRHILVVCWTTAVLLTIAESVHAQISVKVPHSTKSRPIEQQKAIINVTLSKVTDPTTFRALLNGIDITSEFKFASGNALVNLSENAALRAGTAGASLRDYPKRVNNLVLTAKTKGGPKAKSFRKARVFFVVGNKFPLVQDDIGEDGGTLFLPDLALVTFPPGSLTDTAPVSVSQTDSVRIEERWQEETSKFGTDVRVSTEIRIRIGSQQPSDNVMVDLMIPDAFRALLNADDEIRVFAQNISGGEPDDLDLPFPTVILLETRARFDAHIISVMLPPYAFSELAVADGKFEAVLFLGATPTARSASIPLKHILVPIPDNGTDMPLTPSINTGAFRAKTPAGLRVRAHSGDCEGTTLRKPFDGDFPVRSSWGNRIHPISKKSTFHAGTDFAMPIGTPILSAADGTITRIKTDPNGYGYYMDVTHTDGSVTRYAHLTTQSATLAVGATVAAGQQIAQSGNTGGSTGPHLHLEYRPNGVLFGKDGTVDPVPCMNPLVDGSITVRDNGSLADDAFSVAINGITVCTTAIGASNNCGIGNLRPGNATLTLTAVIAPDDVGTYEITLGDGLTFADGTVTRSDVVAQGESVSFPIIIPQPQP